MHLDKRYLFVDIAFATKKKYSPSEEKFVLKENMETMKMKQTFHKFQMKCKFLRRGKSSHFSYRNINHMGSSIGLD